MDGVRAWRFAAPLAIAAAFALAAPLAAQPTPDPPAKTSPELPTKAPDKALRETPSMVFFIAKGEADACGPGCGEWIAADGKFDASTPGRMRALLGRLGKRKLPIYFTSPGGSVDAAIEVGRLMRRTGMQAAVGRTIPQGCDPNQRREKACDAIMRSGRELTAELRTRAACASACVYALLGAPVREVALDAALGIHSISVTRTLTLKRQDGTILAMKSTRLPGNSTSTRDAHEKVVRYAAEMGVGRALIDAAAAVPFEKIRALSREEIASFGIDRRSFIESRWRRDEDRGGRAGLLKYTAQLVGSDSRYRTSLMRLSCATSGQMAVQFVREKDAEEKFKSVSMLSGGHELALTVRGKPTTGNNWLERELRVAFTPRVMLEDAAKSDFIEVVTTAEGNAAPLRMKLSTAGLSAQLASLGAPCF